MQCHKPGHRAPARCVSALLAAGALLAAAVDHLGGTSARPAIQTAAFDPPSVLSPASTLHELHELHELHGPVRPSPGMADPPTPSRAAKRAARHKGHHGRHHQGTAHHAGTYVLTQLPVARNREAATAVHEALSLIGVPYRWGGTTRAGGFDCSGFTQHVWAVAGVKIPRTVRAQARAGTRVSLGKAEPGDLVVFYPTQHHVGIYVGNGLVLDSPHTGASVRPDPVRSMPVSVVVRVRT